MSRHNFSSTGVTGNCESLLSGKSGWSGAFGATFNLPVASAMASFELEIETDLPLSQITFWDADVTPTSGNSFTATNKSWFGGKQAGETLSLGFQVLFLIFWPNHLFQTFCVQVQFNGNTEPAFTSVKLNGVKLC